MMTARGLLTAMHAGEAVGILMDTNMTPPQGVFVRFFGIAAWHCIGLARVALKTGAAVVPGFLLWEQAEAQYVLHFGPELVLAQTEDHEADILAATQQCNDVLESGFAVILTSGSGFTAGGRRGCPESRGCIE